MAVIRKDWWRGGVIYQVYPRSFLDSNDDGIGDLPGVLAKLDYIASLNVDAIWLSPFFTSPMKDFGYDVSDYRGVDPIFGTLDDLRALVAAAHERGLRIIIDQVLNHCSDQHPWFAESRTSRSNDKADWFVWADPNPDGTPPNNWLSVFGGSAWTWEGRRKQYYLHNFLASQPDLNFHCEAVQQQLLDDMEFWLQLGVDGFRLDAANFYFHDQALRNNPPNLDIREGGIGVRVDNPYAYQRHLYDKTQPQNLDFLRRLRALLERYPGTATVAEIGCDDSLRTMAAYTSGGDTLHMAYSFDLLTAQCSPAYIRSTIEAIEGELGDGWPCWSVGNHDVVRVMSRWAHEGEATPERGRLLMSLLLSLRGSVCLYQGEELGLPEAELAFEDLVDPYGITFWPEFKGRDGCRTPMPWVRDGVHAGFSSQQPWLPLDERHRALAVDVQEDDSASMLNSYRRFLAWRQEQPLLIDGDIQVRYHDDDLLVFERRLGEQAWLCLFNLGDRERRYDLPLMVEPLEGVPSSTAEFLGSWVHLPAHGFGFARLLG
ncbi:alpha-glucosidase family protein [Pseudomonas sp. KHPS1]|uniref:Alpha-glucosidase family protein n=1 Tax=Ectopseudomonas oleovorans TaxID=301 RepID=A0AB35L0J7_ECTOL|nr:MULTISPECIES: alpha-glucosidase [Pseudomonas]MCR1827053.1 alpha-glucosidase family protein [Pseudomonas oleovorans]MDH0567029.1 alpha-glucosidase family protein [Pseudomonas oleovorans]UTH37879.1 alpha-glucosidase family protein [Pseudomonas sp. KHPS1]